MVIDVIRDLMLDINVLSISKPTYSHRWEDKSRWSHEKQKVMEQKNKGGRPTKTLSEKRKYQVLLRLNTMEYYTLQGKARETSMSRTEFLRQLITKAEIKSRIKPEDMQLIRCISGMANNLNQIAHRLNTFGISAIHEDLNALKQLIHELLKRLKS